MHGRFAATLPQPVVPIIQRARAVLCREVFSRRLRKSDRVYGEQEKASSDGWWIELPLALISTEESQQERRRESAGPFSSSLGWRKPNLQL